MFEEILLIVDLLKTLIYYCVFYSFLIGQCLVYTISLISYGTVHILKSLTDILIIVLESFTFFCKDVLQGSQQLIEFSVQIYDTFNYVSVVLQDVINSLGSAGNCISGSYSVLQNSALTLRNLAITVSKLLKYVTVLFGSGIWFTVTLIPYSLWNLIILIKNVIQSTPEIIFSGIINGARNTKKCIKDVYLFMTDVPVESVIGILIAVCLIYILTQFYVTVFSYLYSKTRHTIRWILTKFCTLTLRYPRNDVPISDRISTNRRPPLRRTYTTSPVEKNMMDERFCVICQERIKCILVLPCRHVCMCSECNNRLQLYNTTCPICRNDIESTMKIFV